MLALILLTVSGLFMLVIVTKRLLPFKVCALCASIFLTWLGLLFLYRTSRFHDTVLLSLLMGQSIAGLYYKTDGRVKPALHIFTLPFFLTLTTTFYFLITLSKNILPALFVLLGLWVGAYIIFAYRNDPGKKAVSEAVMNCCGDK